MISNLLVPVMNEKRVIPNEKIVDKIIVFFIIDNL